MTRQTICILALSPIAIDARVQRQIEYLAPDYDVVVWGIGPPPERLAGRAGIKWLEFRIERRRFISILRLPLLLLSRFGSKRVFNAWYWSSPTHRRAYRELIGNLSKHIDAIHANDWYTLPIAMRLRRDLGAPIVLDLHEYAPLELEERFLWRYIYAKPLLHLLRNAAPTISASITVAPEIAKRYAREVGLQPIVVLNVPDAVAVDDHSVDARHVRLIHHGAAQRARRLELAIDAIARADERFTLDFMLVGDESYIQFLATYAQRLAPRRVGFRSPVDPASIPGTIAEYDLGIFLLPPTGYSKAQALPNKLFDFIHAGLGVVVGPTPAMAAFVNEHRIGLVTRSFDPEEVASGLNDLTVDDISAMRRASREVGGEFTSAREMAKMVAIYRDLLKSAD